MLECDGETVAAHLPMSVSGCVWYSPRVLKRKSHQGILDMLVVLIDAEAATRGPEKGVNGGQQRNTFRTKMERNR